MSKNMTLLTELGDRFVCGSIDMARLRRLGKRFECFPSGFNGLSWKAEAENQLNARLYASCRVFFGGLK